MLAASVFWRYPIRISADTSVVHTHVFHNYSQYTQVHARTTPYKFTLPHLTRMTVAVNIRQINNWIYVRELWGTDIYPEFIRIINGISTYRVIWTVLPTRWNDSTVDLCGKLTWVCRTTHCCYLAWGLKNSKCFWSDSLRCPLPRCRVCPLLEIRMVGYNNNCQCYTA